MRQLILEDCTRLLQLVVCTLAISWVLHATLHGGFIDASKLVCYLKMIFDCMQACFQCLRQCLFDLWYATQGHGISTQFPVPPGTVVGPSRRQVFQ